MLRLSNILNSLTRRGNAGASVDDFRNEFGDEELDDIKRLVQAALDLTEIKKDGKGRGVRYYIADIEIPQFKKATTGVRKISEDLFLEGVIDLNGCTTVKEKIARIEASEHKLTGLHYFFYREKLHNGLLGRDLLDHVRHSVLDVDVTIAHDAKKKKNVVITTRHKVLSNKLIINREPDGQYTIIKIHLECPDRPEIVRFTLYSEFEKCLKTLQPR